MRHLVYAMKILVNEDLKAQQRRRTRRARRRNAVPEVAPQPALRPTPAVEPATRNAEVARPRRPANAGA